MAYRSRSSRHIAARCVSSCVTISSGLDVDGRVGGRNAGRLSSTANRLARDALLLKSAKSFMTTSPAVTRLAAIEEYSPVAHQRLALLVEIAAPVGFAGLALRPVAQC